MLKSLNIENIAVIEKSNIELCCGFNVLTGETGAGKSIVIDSINAVTGQRTSKELIRTGCDKASVSAVFDCIPKKVSDKLSEYGIESDDGSIMMLRIINSDGRNTCKINGITVSVAVLREIGDMLVNIHGQHDNQALLNPDNHCGFIDAYGRYDDVLNAYRDCYGRLKAVRRELKNLITDEDEKNKRTDLLKYQINEIEAASVVPGELETLIKRREVIRNSEKLRVTLEMCYKQLAGDDDTVGADTLVSQTVSAFNSCATLLPESEKITERLFAASSEISDLTEDIRKLCDSVSFDPGELEQCEQRIELLNSFKRKYGDDENAVLKYLESAKAELDAIFSYEEKIAELEKLSDCLEDELVEKGSVLTNARKQCAELFTQKVSDILKYLEMPNVIFLTSIEQGIYTSYGCDKIEFLISANLGQAPKPLSKIASGGELSRIMLAIKSVLSDIDDANTLIFDEIDAGISGKAADKVGRQLKALSQNKQVICVTHLAQIAAAAGNHLLISKSFDEGNTYTHVKTIDGDARISEIARIMSGDVMTENLYKSAKDLIENHKS